MNQTMNSSVTPQPTPNSSRTDAVKVAYFVFSTLTMLTCMCGMVGNSLVIYLLGFHVQRTRFCIYILNLAAADLLFLLSMASEISLEITFQNVTSLEITFPDEKDPETFLHDVKVKAIEVLKRVKYFAYVADLSLLTAISSQRCLSVLFPIWYKCHQPQYLSAVVCALLWVLSMVMNMLASFFCSRFRKYDKHECLAVDITMSTLVLGIFTPLMVLSSLVLFVQVQRRAQQRRHPPSRLLVVILSSVLVFLVCSLPFGIYWFILFWVKLNPKTKALCVSLSRISSSLSSSANPIIYFLVGRQRRWHQWESLGARLNRALQEEPELEGKEMSPSGTNEVVTESQPSSSPAQESPARGISMSPAANPACLCHATCVESCWVPRRLCTPPY